MLRRANARVAGTIAAGALVAALLCLGAILLSRTFHGPGSGGAIARAASTDVSTGARAASSATDSIAGAVVHWVDGSVKGHHASGAALQPGGAAGTQSGWLGSGGRLGGPLGDDWIKDPGRGRDPSFGLPGGDPGGPGGRSGGGSGGDSGGGGSGGGGRGSDGEEHGPGHGSDWGPIWGWGFDPPAQGMDLWTPAGALHGSGGTQASGGAPQGSSGSAPAPATGPTPGEAAPSERAPSDGGSG